MKKRHIIKSFVEAGMIDEETGMVSVFDRLIGTCKRWSSCLKNVGVLMHAKEHCKKRFQSLMKVKFDEGQISYPIMRAHAIPVGECDKIML